MNVKCKKCGKIFDAETYSCLCPNCGTWYISVDQFDIQNVDYKNDQWSWNQEDTHDSDPVDGQGNVQENTADLIHDIHESRDEHQEQQESQKQQESQERDIDINVPKRNSKWAAVLLAIVVSFLVIGTVVVINGGSIKYDYDDDNVDDLTPAGVRRNNEHTYIDARMRTKTGIIVRPLYTFDMEEMINTDQDIDNFA